MDKDRYPSFSKQKQAFRLAKKLMWWLFRDRINSSAEPWHMQKHSSFHFMNNLWKTRQFSMYCFLCTNTVVSPRRLSKCPRGRVTETNSDTYLPACDWQLYWQKDLFEFWQHFSLSLSFSLSHTHSPFTHCLWIFWWSCKLVCGFHSSEKTTPNTTEARQRLTNQHQVGSDVHPREESTDRWYCQKELQFATRLRISK